MFVRPNILTTDKSARCVGKRASEIFNYICGEGAELILEAAPVLKSTRTKRPSTWKDETATKKSTQSAKNADVASVI